jgi:Immunoglobulin domain
MPFSFGDEPFTSGASAHTVCAVTEGDLPMDINWIFEGQKHSSMMGIATLKVGPRSNMLTIESVAAAHSGQYTCMARNGAGSRNFTTSLIVYGKNCRGGRIFKFFKFSRHPKRSDDVRLGVWNTKLTNFV